MIAGQFDERLASSDVFSFPRRKEDASRLFSTSSIGEIDLFLNFFHFIKRCFKIQNEKEMKRVCEQFVTYAFSLIKIVNVNFYQDLSWEGIKYNIHASFFFYLVARNRFKYIYVLYISILFYAADF